MEKSAPIIIKSVEQAKVATDDELRRVAQEMNFNLPPPSSGKRPVNSSGRKKTFTPSSGKRKGKSLSRRGSEQENIINSSITSAENTTISGLKELTKRQDTIEPIAHETLVQSPISFSENVNSTLESRKALFAVLESISYVMQNGKPSDIAAEGSIHVKIIPEASDSMILRYQLSTEDKVKKASPNENIVSSLGDGIFEAKVPAGSGSVSLFNYSIECDTDDVPLILFPDWKITDTSAKLDLQVSLSADFQALESIAVLFALGPLDADISILQAEPSTLKHDKTVQKIMWKLPGLNADQRTATYSIEFASDRRVTPSAIAVQFSCTGFSVSGIHLDCIQLDQSYYALGGIVQKTKSNKVVCKSHI